MTYREKLLQTTISVLSEALKVNQALRESLGPAHHKELDELVAKSNMLHNQSMELFDRLCECDEPN